MTDLPAADFVHLHVHTQYSLLDGAIRLDDLMNKCKEYGMDSVAITDHGAMFGALEFYVKAQKAGIKPIIGCEFYIAPKSRFKKGARSAGEAAFHLVLLAMDRTGYSNLMKLATIAQLEGFYYKPRIDKEVLEAHTEGLIALTACLHGEIPHLIVRNDMKGAKREAEYFHSLFKDRFYLEMQENGIPEQTIVNNGLKELSRELGIPLVATNDCHYLNRDEAHAHELLLCVQTGKTINDPGRFRFSTDQLYFKSPDEMKESFGHSPEAIRATVEIAARCNLELKFGKNHFPLFPVAKNETLESMFDTAARTGLEERLQEIREKDELDSDKEKTYRSRLEMELKIIKTKGFAGYFLIVADFINWAKGHGIPVGPGRGSGAGSLAAYCTKITDIDPIPYGLIFERFLNEERVSMPDFDIDFCQERRSEVLGYVQDKYGGAEHVAQIVTYGSMKARGVLRDVGRALAIPFGDVDRIAKLVPDQLKITLKEALQQEPRLKEAAKRDPQIDELLTIAQVLEGLPRHTSTHAAGVVISPEPMVEYLPMCKGPKGEVLTQYDMKFTEMTGLIKFDFLGLKTLTVIDKTVKLVEEETKTGFDIGKIPMDDTKTFDLLCKGDALGVFQLESSGMRSLLTSMKPELFTDLIALVALYRPGPLESGMIDDFVNTKHGTKKASYTLPQLKPILEETYGVIVYQEQVMKIANVLASYSLGDADILRRAMGKKIPEVMEKEREKFMTGAKSNNIPPDKAEKIFDLMAKFAGYGFNKSHSAAYAMISYQTAYLKAHYPAQFMAALLSCDMNNTDKVVLYINECKDHDIDVLPPDINESDHDFTVINNRIRFGLSAVKNVGDAALDSVMEEKKKEGPFTSLEDFCVRVDSRRVNKRVIESLIKAGAFDSIKVRRSQLFAILDKAMKQAHAAQKDRQSGQISLFSIIPETDAVKAATIDLPDIPEWSDKEKLEFEKETVGFYITGHPLDNYRDEIKAVADVTTAELAGCGEGRPVRIGGLVRTLKEHKSKRGERMGFVTLEDMSGAVEVVVFPETFAQCSELLLDDTTPIIIQGMVKKDERGAKIIADSVDSLERATEKYISDTRIMLLSEKVSRAKIEELRKLVSRHYGPCPISLTLHFANRGEVDIEVPKEITVRPGRKLSRDVSALLGYTAIHYIKSPAELKPRRGKNSRKAG
ncbi:MAG: DNA polymerase III subunit alpha [Desulfobulbaceae bacterium]|nr:DNA polymerase III subunit alpha [Desulfobulbaceae bacterium]